MSGLWPHFSLLILSLGVILCYRVFFRLYVVCLSIVAVSLVDLYYSFIPLLPCWMSDSSVGGCRYSLLEDVTTTTTTTTDGDDAEDGVGAERQLSCNYYTHPICDREYTRKQQHHLQLPSCRHLGHKLLC